MNAMIFVLCKLVYIPFVSFTFFDQFIFTLFLEMFLKKIFRLNFQYTSKFAQTAIGLSRRTMHSNYRDYVRFLELVGNVKVSSNYKISSFHFFPHDETKTSNNKKKTIFTVIVQHHM